MRLKEKQQRSGLTLHLEDKKAFLEDETPIGPLLIVPWIFTDRIESQGGRFIYCGSDPYTPLENHEINEKVPWDLLDSYEIPSCCKKSILKELRFCSIHNATLFPDLDGWAKYLRNDY